MVFDFAERPAGREKGLATLNAKEISPFIQAISGVAARDGKPVASPYDVSHRLNDVWRGSEDALNKVPRQANSQRC